MVNIFWVLSVKLGGREWGGCGEWIFWELGYWEAVKDFKGVGVIGRFLSWERGWYGGIKNEV